MPRELGMERLTVLSDSQLAIKQVVGKFQAKDHSCQDT